MKLVFWASALVVVYAYLGYPCWLWLCSRWKSLPIRAAEVQPFVSIVLAVRDGEGYLEAKLANLAALEYPAERREIVVVSDGSRDRTNSLLAAHAGGAVRVILLPQPQGKAVALNHGVQAARGEVVVFTDVRQRIAPDAVSRLANALADPQVGAVSGELMLEEGRGHGLGAYWRWEKMIRQWESLTGSVMGVTGALYAVRRHLLVPLPAGTILDDVWVPMQVIRARQRVLFEPAARAYDNWADSGHEFRRKVRTLTGNYQLLQLAPWLLTSANPEWFRFASHKLSRLLVPFALLGLLVSSLLTVGVLYRFVLILQVVFYALAALAGPRGRVPGIGRLAELSRSFLLLNAAAALAFVYFITGKREVWSR